LRKSGFSKDIKVVFSPERREKIVGSFVGATGAFGLKICSTIVSEVRNGIRRT
jgi:tRNA A37 threonylcarbamoyladenosine dehydratase